MVVDQAARDVLARMVASDKQHRERKERDKLPDVWVLALFKKLQARFLHKWTSAIDGVEEGIMREWAIELRGLTGEQIRNGLDNWRHDWPPGSGEFRDACLGRQKNGYGLNYVPQYYRVQPADQVKRLENTASKETRESNLSKCREMLKGVRV